MQERKNHKKGLKTKDMNKEKDFVYFVTVVRSTHSMMFGWLYSYESHKVWNKVLLLIHILEKSTVARKTGQNIPQQI